MPTDCAVEVVVNGTGSALSHLLATARRIAPDEDGAMALVLLRLRRRRPRDAAALRRLAGMVCVEELAPADRGR